MSGRLVSTLRWAGVEISAGPGHALQHGQQVCQVGLLVNDPDGRFWYPCRPLSQG